VWRHGRGRGGLKSRFAWRNQCRRAGDRGVFQESPTASYNFLGLSHVTASSVSVHAPIFNGSTKSRLKSRWGTWRLNTGRRFDPHRACQISADSAAFNRLHPVVGLILTGLCALIVPSVLRGSLFCFLACARTTAPTFLARKGGAPAKAHLAMRSAMLPSPYMRAQNGSLPRKTWATRPRSQRLRLRFFDGQRAIFQERDDLFAVYLQSSVVADQAPPPELVHEFTYPWAGSAYHLCQG